MRFQLRCQLGLQASGGSAGNRGFISEMSDPLSSWQQTAVPCHVSLTTELLNEAHNLAAGFPQSKRYKRKRLKPQCLLQKLQCDFCLFLFIRGNSSEIFCFLIFFQFSLWSFTFEGSA